MSAGYRDQWLYLRPVIRTEKNNKQIIIEPFSAPCGPTNNCLFGNSTDGQAAPLTAPDLYEAGLALDMSQPFTIELWIKPFQDSGTVKKDILWFERLNGAFFNFVYTGMWLYMQNSKLCVDLSISQNIQTIISTQSLNINQWNHIALTFDGATFKIYINTIEDASFYSGLITDEQGNPILDEQGNPILAESFIFDMVAGTRREAFANFADNPDDRSINFCGTRAWYGWMDEFRVWQVCRSGPEIAAAAFSQRDVSGNIDVGLKQYYKFNDAVGSAFTTNSITGHTVIIDAAIGRGTKTIDGDEHTPLHGFGASFVAYEARFTFSGPSSLKFPTKRPVDCNHALVVRWLDNSGNVARRKIYGNVGEDINPDPPAYNGERLPANFVLEFWNIDGEPTIDLLEELIIGTSHTMQPTTGTDHTHATDGSQSDTSALAADFPWTFPVSFNTQQTY